MNVLGIIRNQNEEKINSHLDIIIKNGWSKW